jgi:hypothetical protein
MKNVNKLCSRNAEFLNVKAGRTCINHCDVKGKVLETSMRIGDTRYRVSSTYNACV